MKLPHWLFALAFLLPLCSFGQGKFLRSYGYSSLLDVYNVPLKISDDTTEAVQYSQNPTFSVLTLFYEFRYNLLEMDDNTSLSISGMPMLSAQLDFGNFDVGYALNLSAPLYLSYNKGVSATNRSLSYVGFGASLGVEYIRPVLYLDENSGLISQSGFLLPMAKLSYRAYHPLVEAGYEMFILGSFGSATVEGELEARSAWHAMLGIKWNWNY